ncbi:MAG: sigma-70 family RNA polymerase sigma factor [Pirellulaceae bacterium]|nr:sigma-70 family RNA polymerase sigma factor [Pirellulaceae bacterium]
MAIHEYPSDKPGPSPRGERFATTRWTMVLCAGGGQSPESRAALAVLCESYWFPLYAFVRRAGHSVDDAQDLTQEFFARLLAQPLLERADREKGKFRTFLLAAMKHFLADQWDRARAQKRGGGRAVVSFDAMDAEARYRLEPADDLTPERIFERQWALALLEHVLSRLESEMASDGRSPLFDALKDTLGGGRSATHAAIAAELGMTEGAVKVAAHRLRRRYRTLLREEIAQTVAGPDEVGDEIRYLLSCL